MHNCVTSSFVIAVRSIYWCHLIPTTKTKKKKQINFLLTSIIFSYLFVQKIKDHTRTFTFITISRTTKNHRQPASERRRRRRRTNTYSAIVVDGDGVFFLPGGLECRWSRFFSRPIDQNCHTSWICSGRVDPAIGLS